MTALNERVRIARRYLRSIRIDTDLGESKALQGFICPQSSANVLITMARHVSEARQGAFTWTGPYGSGKSSLVIALSALLGRDVDLQKKASEVFGYKFARILQKSLPMRARGWRILPVVGRRDDPVLVVGKALQESGLARQEPSGGWTEGTLIQKLVEVAARPRSYGGLFIFIDEMGKFLESAAQDGTDIYFFQQLAEVASRSQGRLLVTGVLHQAFEDYAHRLSREMRDEWAKIQGRFVDLAVNTGGHEQIDLISRAIESDHRPAAPSSLSTTVASLVCRDRPADAERLAVMLEGCWPLHPVVACLLGPMSSRRFGQNQRSIFGFLNSAEPYSLQDFLHGEGSNSLYSPARLWDYLRANLESSILASPDGHRWALAVESLERCESMGSDELHIRLLKVIAIVDLFKERSKLLPSFELLSICFSETSHETLAKALDQLCDWSLTIFKKFLGSYAIYAGSDFDIEGAVKRALSEDDRVDFVALKTLAGLQPILAKRHYHETGSMRWFEINLAPLCDILDIVSRYQPSIGAVGQFLLALPTEGEDEEETARICRETADQCDRWDIVVGFSKRSWVIITLAREVVALENVRISRPELAGDAVARREVTGRLATLQGQLETEMHRAFDGAVWFQADHSPRNYRRADLCSLASQLADQRFDKCPKLHNELLNRQRPSSSAVAAQNALLRRMILNEGEPRLGIEGYPAEGGLFVSLLEATALYVQDSDRWRFVPPPTDDSCRLLPLWEAATEYIRNNSDRTIPISAIYDLWRRQPLGVKDGLMPILVVAFILSHRNRLAAYREGIFRARFDDVDVEYLAKDPTAIQLRWLDLSDQFRRLLSGMSEVVHALDDENSLVHLEPIDVARGLVGIYDRLPQWTKRTMRLSKYAIRVRDILKRAHDPNRFLFDDIPAVVGVEVSGASDEDLKRVIAALREGIEELQEAYASMLHRLRDVMLAELEVPNTAPRSLVELRERAANVRKLAGDFHLEAFVGRLIQFDGSDQAFEGIASLAASKPPRYWVDPDLDRAAINLAEMAQKFLRAEIYARVKGRSDKRQAVAVVIGINGRPTPLLEEFAVADGDRIAVNDLVERVATALSAADTTQRRIILAALAELSARYIQEVPKGSNPESSKAVL